MSPDQNYSQALGLPATEPPQIISAQAPTVEAPVGVKPPEPGEIPSFFHPTLRPGLRQKLWTRKLGKIFSKKVSRTTGIDWKDKDGKVVKHTRHKGRSKRERRIIRFNLTHQPTA